ncbi:hypothetical protein [Sphingobium sp. Z007]|uniref:hypothetical protein n=1 Tax=Sphingobium sp. Z007 TaxID=627495 RepID=UPI001124FD6C|nr:hypothetical protein [Sphingobium sp. Z007]
MMDTKAFRAMLAKIMPGYSWTVHRATKGATCLTATGIQTSGFNRLSTLQVTYSTDSKGDWYKARSAGFGKRAPWLHENGDLTLALALRGLQDHYQYMAAAYDGHARALQGARRAAAVPAA